MAKIINSDKPEATYYIARNAESSSSIPVGTPVALVMNGTNDGLDVVLPATATATKAGVLSFGVATGAIAAGAKGQVQVYGFCRNALVVKRTRAATTDSWASTAAGAVGDVLAVDTVDNCFRVTPIVTGNVFTGAATTDTKAQALAMFAPMAVLAETYVSYTTLASTTSNAVTVSTALVKVFLRML